MATWDQEGRVTLMGSIFPCIKGWNWKNLPVSLHFLHNLLPSLDWTWCLFTNYVTYYWGSNYCSWQGIWRHRAPNTEGNLQVLECVSWSDFTLAFVWQVSDGCVLDQASCQVILLVYHHCSGGRVTPLTIRTYNRQGMRKRYKMWVLSTGFLHKNLTWD